MQTAKNVGIAWVAKLEKKMQSPHCVSDKFINLGFVRNYKIQKNWQNNIFTKNEEELSNAWRWSEIWPLLQFYKLFWCSYTSANSSCAHPSPPPPPWLLQSIFFELGICQPRGHLPAFDTHVVSFSNIIYHRGFYSKHKHIGPSIKDGKKLYQFLKARFLDFMHVFFSLGYPPFF